MGKTPSGVAQVHGTGTAVLANIDNDADALDLTPDRDGIDGDLNPDEDSFLPRASDSVDEIEPVPNGQDSSTPM